MVSSGSSAYLMVHTSLEQVRHQVSGQWIKDDLPPPQAFTSSQILH